MKSSHEVIVRKENKNNVLILHSYHRPIEEYGREVALEIEKMALPGIIVAESPRKRVFDKILKQYRAKWAIDLHSDPYKSTPGEHLRRASYPLAVVRYGGKMWDPETVPESKLDLGIMNEVGELLWKFELEKYGTDEVLFLDPFYPERQHRRLIVVGLLWYRPMNQSVELIKSLAQYLQRWP